MVNFINRDYFSITGEKREMDYFDCFLGNVGWLKNETIATNSKTKDKIFGI